MLFATIEELELQGVSYKEASQIIFQNKLFTRALDFPKKSRQVALMFCKEYLKANLHCLLVESHSYITVWIEKQEITSITEKENTVNDFKQSNSTSFSSQIKAKFDYPTQSYLNFRDLSNDSHSTHDDKLSQEVLYEFSAQEETSSDNLSQIQEISKVDTPPSSEQPLNQKASGKKRPPRKYRGISY